MGFDERRTMALPIFGYQWADGWFAGVPNGVGYNFSRSPDMQYGARVTVDIGRKESRSAVRRGLGDIDPSAEIGGFFNCSPAPSITLTSSLRLGAGCCGNGLLVDDAQQMKAWGCRSRRAAMTNFRELESLRNHLAHTQDLVDHHWPQIVRIARRFDEATVDFDMSAR